MRKAKDNTHVPKRYYRPLLTNCPRCGAPLRRRSTVWRKACDHSAGSLADHQSGLQL